MSLFAASLATAMPAFAQAPAPAIEKTDDPIDVRVEGDRGAPPRASRDPNVASYVVRGADLKRPGASAVDVLSASPGVEGARSGAGSDLATLSIRGAPSAELPVYLAGIRLNDDVTGAADLSTVPLFALDRIEIYRGNAPADAGRMGIGGAIFFEPRLPRGTHAGASAGAGSFGELSFGGFASLGNERGGALFSFTRQSATNDFTYRDDRRTASPADDRAVQRDNGDATTYDAWAIGRVELPHGGRLVLVANAFAREQGIVGTTMAPAHEARSASQREIAAASIRMPCAAGAAGEDSMDRCSIEIASSAIAARRDLHDPVGELGFFSKRVAISGDRWEEKLRVRARIGERWRLAAGAIAGVDRLDVDPTSGPRVRASRLSITGSADAAFRATDWLSLFAVGGGECHTAVGAPGAEVCASGGPAGRAGARITGPLGLEAVLSGGSYVRVPTLGELHGLSGTVLGNDALVPERGVTAEVELRWSSTSSSAVHAYADVTGFARFVDNLILYRLTRPGTIKPFNIASARVLGIEALAGADFAHHVRAEASLTLLDPRDITPGLQSTSDLLPYHATVTATSLLEVYANLEPGVRIVNRLGAAARFRYRSSRFADDTASVYLAEQRNLDIDASARLMGSRITARFAVSNLLDTLDRDLLGFALPPRAFHGSIEATW